MTETPAAGPGAGPDPVIASGPSRRMDRIRHFILHHNKGHPRDIWDSGGRGLPDPPRGREGVSASTQNQAKSAVLFLYKEVLGEPLPWLEGIESASGRRVCRSC